jgi:hypothetical protein
MNRKDLIDDLSLVPLPPWWQSPGGIAAIVLALAALAFLVWLLRRRLRREVVVLDTPPMQPDLHPEFLRRLAELRARRAQLSAYDLALGSSDILRDYLEWRFQLAIRFQTTREFLDSSRQNTALAETQRAALGAFLGFCDLVKFARRGADPAEQDHLLDTAEAFIRQGATPKGAVA